MRRIAKSLRPRALYQWSGAKQYSARTKHRHERVLADVQRTLNRVPFRRTADPARFGRYVNALTEPMTWGALQRNMKLRVLREDRFQANKHRQWALNRKVDVLCKPREGTDQTLLLYGNGASTNLFGKAKKNVKGPARQVFDQAVRRKKAVCIWADEFSTSKRSFDGHLLSTQRNGARTGYGRRRAKPPVTIWARHSPVVAVFATRNVATRSARWCTTALSTPNAISNTICTARPLVPSTSVARGTETWWGR